MRILYVFNGVLLMIYNRLHSLSHNSALDFGTAILKLGITSESLGTGWKHL